MWGLAFASVFSLILGTFGRLLYLYSTGDKEHTEERDEKKTTQI